MGRPLKPVIASCLCRLAARGDARSGAAPASDRSPASLGVYPAEGERRGRVAMLTGCAQPVLNPGINEAAIRLLNRSGVEVVLPKGEGCCGALVHHMGEEKAGHAFAQANIEAWTREIEGEGLDAIVITASGCGTTVKDYGFMFRNDPVWARTRQARLRPHARCDRVRVQPQACAAIARDGRCRGLSLGVLDAARAEDHGPPKKLLKEAGFVVKDVPEGHICCGSAGVYNILQPEIAGQLRERKVSNIEKTRPEIIATGNIGCMTQIGKGLADRGSPVPIVHTVELLDWATGGPMPAMLEQAGFTHRDLLPQLRHAAE